MVRQVLDRIRQTAPSILPSLLLCDFGNLAAEVARLEEAEIPALHLDVMDGNFVPNLTYGMPIVSAVRKLTSLPLDVHLMIREPDRYIKPFADAGADLLTVHIETLPDPIATAARIHEQGMAAGVALNPATPLDAIIPSLAAWDMILVMSVPAGFGGQAFHPVALEKLSTLRTMTGPTVVLEVDGGISLDTIAACVRAGSQAHVVGSAIFKQPNYALAVRNLRESALGHLDRV